MMPFILLLLTAPDSAKLTLVPNTKEILQCDNLLLFTVLENNSISAVRLLGEPRLGGRIRYEVQEKDQWVQVRPAGDQLTIPCFLPGNGDLLEGKSTLAECEVLHRRSLDGAFLFETPGKYQIRAVAKMPWGDLPSESVTITVGKRAEIALKMIDSVQPKDLWVLAHPSLKRPLPENLLKLKYVGGNIARTIDHWLMAKTVSEGGEWKGTRAAKEQACERLRENMDPVAYEHYLEHLGSYYEDRDGDSLARVASAMKYDSRKRRGFTERLEFLRTLPTPAKP